MQFEVDLVEVEDCAESDLVLNEFAPGLESTFELVLELFDEDYVKVLVFILLIEQVRV